MRITNKQGNCFIDCNGFNGFDSEGHILIQCCYEQNNVYKYLDFNESIQLRDYLTDQINLITKQKEGKKK